MLEDRLDAVETHPLLVVDVGKGPEDQVDDLVDQQATGHLLDQHEGQHEHQRHEEIPEERPVVLLAEHHRPAHQITAEQLGEGDPDEGDPVGAVSDEKRERHPEAIESDEDVDRADGAGLAADEAEEKRKEGHEHENADGREQKLAHVDPGRDQQRDEEQRQKDGRARRLDDRGRRGRGFGFMTAGPACGRRPYAGAGPRKDRRARTRGTMRSALLSHPGSFRPDRGTGTVIPGPGGHENMRSARPRLSYRAIMNPR